MAEILAINWNEPGTKAAKRDLMKIMNTKGTKLVVVTNQEQSIDKLLHIAHQFSTQHLDHHHLDAESV